MKAAILGLGKIGHNTAATLVDRGLEVTGFTRDEEKARAINEHGITVSGALNGNFKVKAFTNIAQAIDGARFLVVTTTAKGHRPMAELLKGKLQEGQRIVIFTGNWGAYEFYSVLRDEVREKHVIIGETSGNLAASPSLTYPATTFMKTSKKVHELCHHSGQHRPHGSGGAEAGVPRVLRGAQCAGHLYEQYQSPGPCAL